MAELCSCPSISWKIELVSNEIGHLVELFLSKVLKVQLEFSRMFIVKMQNDLTDFVIKREAKFKIWKSLSLSILQKVSKHIWKRPVMVWPRDLLKRRLVWV